MLALPIRSSNFPACPGVRKLSDLPDLAGPIPGKTSFNIPKIAYIYFIKSFRPYEIQLFNFNGYPKPDAIFMQKACHNAR